MDQKSEASKRLDRVYAGERLESVYPWGTHEPVAGLLFTTVDTMRLAHALDCKVKFYEDLLSKAIEDGVPGGLKNQLRRSH